MGAVLNSFERELKMPKASKAMLALLLGCSFTFGCALTNGAIAKDHRKPCVNSAASNVQACGKQAIKVKPKKPGADSGKGISPGALLLLQLIL
jgi:hypothetical protein